MRLGKIEKRILKLKEEIANKPLDVSLSSSVTMATYEKRLEKALKLLNDELEQLETERRFILDRREGLFWKFIWNILIPIIVSVITTYMLSALTLMNVIKNHN